MLSRLWRENRQKESHSSSQETREEMTRELHTKLQVSKQETFILFKRSMINMHDIKSYGRSIKGNWGLLILDSNQERMKERMNLEKKGVVRQGFLMNNSLCFNIEDTQETNQERRVQRDLCFPRIPFGSRNTQSMISGNEEPGGKENQWDLNLLPLFPFKSI